MIINQNIPAILREFLNLQRRIMKNSTPSKLPQLLLLNLLAKFVGKEKLFKVTNFCSFGCL